jgi:hypothetical protein
MVVWSTNATLGQPLANLRVAQAVADVPVTARTITLSAKARPENAEIEGRVKRRRQRLHREQCPPSFGVPSFVTIAEVLRGHHIDMFSDAQPTHPHSCNRIGARYNRDRPLGLQMPEPTSRPTIGATRSRPVLNGLHHIFERTPENGRGALRHHGQHHGGGSPHGRLAQFSAVGAAQPAVARQRHRPAALGVGNTAFS